MQDRARVVDGSEAAHDRRVERVGVLDLLAIGTECGGHVGQPPLRVLLSLRGFERKPLARCAARCGCTRCTEAFTACQPPLSRSTEKIGS